MDRRFIAKKEFNLNRFIIYKKKNMNELLKDFVSKKIVVHG